jgi:hypothetical protein
LYSIRLGSTDCCRYACTWVAGTAPSTGFAPNHFLTVSRRERCRARKVALSAAASDIAKVVDVVVVVLLLDDTRVCPHNRAPYVSASAPGRVMEGG